ncbi:hypothetical protein ACES2L_07535 [Bdellovibrio bacteriovorus]
MKTAITVALLASALSIQASAAPKVLTCENLGKTITITIDEDAKSLNVRASRNNLVFEIYDNKTYAVDAGSVASYQVKNGVATNGSSISGEVAVLTNQDGSQKAALNFLNDSLGKAWLSIDQMDCK